MEEHTLRTEVERDRGRPLHDKPDNLSKFLVGLAFICWLYNFIPLGAAFQPGDFHDQWQDYVETHNSIYTDIWFLLSLSLLILLLFWMHRRTRWLWAKNGPQNITPLQSVYFWFVPILGFYKPRIALMNLTKLLPDTKSSIARKRVHFYWISLLVSFFVDLSFPYIMNTLPDTIRHLFGTPEATELITISAVDVWSGWMFLLAVISLTNIDFGWMIGD